MIKIMCPSCDELLEVNETQEKLYCTKCFKNISIEQGKKYLVNYINKHTSLAFRYLNVATEYKKAREEFEKVVKLVSGDPTIIEGLIKSTLLMSTLRHSYISESLNYLNQYYDVLQHDIFSNNKRLIFIEEINQYLNTYIKTLEERLMDEDRFYELEGKNIYLKVIDEVKEYKQRIIDLYFINRNFTVKSSLTRARLEKDLNILTHKKNINYGIQSSPFHLLNTSVVECYINDQIFLDNRKLYKSRNIIIVWSLILFLIQCIGIMFIFLLPKRLLIGVPIAVIGFIGTITLLIIRIFIQKKLK